MSQTITTGRPADLGAVSRRGPAILFVSPGIVNGIPRHGIGGLARRADNLPYHPDSGALRVDVYGAAVLTRYGPPLIPRTPLSIHLCSVFFTCTTSPYPLRSRVLRKWALRIHVILKGITSLRVYAFAWLARVPASSHTRRMSRKRRAGLGLRAGFDGARRSARGSNFVKFPRRPFRIKKASG